MSIQTRPAIESLYQFNSSFNATDIIEQFWLKTQTPLPGVALNFIGTQVAAKIHPPRLEEWVGKIEGPPDPGNWHADIAEWAATLRTVEKAQDIYRIIEVGCGWGCWLTNMGVAARRRGLAVELIGIEGDAQHLEHAEETLRLNGFSPKQFTLYHGIAAPHSNPALFPRSTQGETIWNKSAIFNPSARQLEHAKTEQNMQILECYPLSKLALDQPFDLLHIDIQGAEVDFITGNYADVLKYAKRVFIGTHSRKIEGDLIAFFLERNWALEMERPALTPIMHGKPHTTIDGVQLWLNPNFPDGSKG